MLCSECGFTNSEDSRFCEMCGTPLLPPALSDDEPEARLCPSCGTANGPIGKFCRRCGTPLDPPAPAEPGPPPGEDALSALPPSSAGTPEAPPKPRRGRPRKAKPLPSEPAASEERPKRRGRRPAAGRPRPDDSASPGPAEVDVSVGESLLAPSPATEAPPAPLRAPEEPSSDELLTRTKAASEAGETEAVEPLPLSPAGTPSAPAEAEETDLSGEPLEFPQETPSGIDFAEMESLLRDLEYLSGDAIPVPEPSVSALSEGENGPAPEPPAPADLPAETPSSSPIGEEEPRLAEETPGEPFRPLREEAPGELEALLFGPAPLREDRREEGHPEGKAPPGAREETPRPALGGEPFPPEAGILPGPELFDETEEPVAEEPGREPSVPPEVPESEDPADTPPEGPSLLPELGVHVPDPGEDRGAEEPSPPSERSDLDGLAREEAASDEAPLPPLPQGEDPTGGEEGPSIGEDPAAEALPPSTTDLPPLSGERGTEEGYGPTVAPAAEVEKPLAPEPTETPRPEAVPQAESASPEPVPEPGPLTPPSAPPPEGFEGEEPRRRLPRLRLRLPRFSLPRIPLPRIPLKGILLGGLKGLGLLLFYVLLLFVGGGIGLLLARWIR